MTPAEFTARTKGPPAELSEHLGRLEQKFNASLASDPEESRDLLSAFTKSVIATTDAIIAHPEADAGLRARAVAFQFIAHDRRKAIDPNAEDETLAAADRIEAATTDPRVKFLACEKRTKILGERAATASDADREQKYKALVDAMIHTVGLDPPPARSAENLGHLANDCEAKRLYPLARQVEEVLMTKFPDTLDGRFAKGAAHRHDLKGKVIDDLEGLGIDGKPISIKDFRGKVVVVCFWVVSHEASVAEVEEIDAFRTKYDPKDLQILGVSLEPNSDAALKFLTAKKITWPQIESKIKDENLESELNLRYGIRSLSYRMVIDREGRLVDYGYIFSHVRPSVEKSPAAAPGTETGRGKGQREARRTRFGQGERVALRKFLKIVLACASRPVYISGQRLSWCSSVWLLLGSDAHRRACPRPDRPA